VVQQGQSPSANSSKQKYGLWEDGKRILWFEEDQVDAINKGSLNFRDFFRDPESALACEKQEHFFHPNNFIQRSKAIRSKVNETRKVADGKYGPGMMS